MSTVLEASIVKSPSVVAPSAFKAPAVVSEPASTWPVNDPVPALRRFLLLLIT